MAKPIYHGLQTSLKGVVSPTSIVTGANIKKPAKGKPKPPPKPAKDK